MTSIDLFENITLNKVRTPIAKSYAAIIGLNPSQGARSPKLWNAAFKNFGIDAEMIALDVSPENLERLIILLEADQNFIGGAIAAPHKETTARILRSNLTAEAGHIGSINCLFRDENGNLCGTNTDGEGSLLAFESIFGPLRSQEILILGSGGTGKAVAAYFASAVSRSNQIILSSRSEAALSLSTSLNTRVVKWQDIGTVAREMDVIINCTSLGSNLAPDLSPIPAETWPHIQNTAIIYDVVYDPDPTAFLRAARDIGLRTLNGSAMNLEQAVLGFHYAATNGKKSLDSNMIREAMKLS